MSSNKNHIGAFSVKVSGSLAAGASNSVIFTLNVLNPCTAATISTTGVSDQAYVIGDSQITFTVPPFT